MKYLGVFVLAIGLLTSAGSASAQTLRRIIPSATPTPVPVRINVPLRVVSTSVPTPIPTTKPAIRLRTISSPTPVKTIPTPTIPAENKRFTTPIITTGSALTSIASTAARLKVGVITSADSATREGKLVYTMRVKEQLKLFGFIPISADTAFEVDAATKNLRKSTRPWWSFLASKPDWTTVFKELGPNLTIKDVTWNKKSYHAGDTAKLSFKIANTGTVGVWQSDPVTTIWKVNAGTIYTDHRPIFINPGEEWSFTNFKWNSIQCDKQVSLQIDSTNLVSETDKKDNIWNGYSTCAPTTGPDLIVTLLKFENAGYSPEKFVGIQNTLKYTVANVGTSPSVPTRAIIKTTGAQYIGLIDIPALVPFITQSSGTVKYTPTNCDPVEMSLDTENKVVETDEDNNIIYEPAEVTDHCNKSADLTVDNVYWKSGAGYSFGKPNKNGDVLNFEVTLANTSFDPTWACVHQVQLGVYQDGQLVNTIAYGDLGPSPKCTGGGKSGSYDYPKIVKTQKFNYSANCGSTLTLVIDPNHNFTETNKSNNSWSQTIGCE